MSSPGLALQKAIVAALKALGTEAGQNVFDRVDPTSPFPRITIGPRQTLPRDATCIRGAEIRQQIDVWSQATGFPQAGRIADAIYERLHDGDLTLGGHWLDDLRVENMVEERDPDGITSRVRIELLALTQPAV